MISFKKGSLIFTALFASIFLLDVTNGQDVKHQCNHNPEIMIRCATNYEPVCAYFKDEQNNQEFAQRDSVNSCTACAEETSIYYIQGRCPGNKVYCDKKAVRGICTLEYSPVCAHTADGSFTAGNRCAACADWDVNYYVVGECN